MLRSLSRAHCALASNLFAPHPEAGAPREVERRGEALAHAAPGRLPDQPQRRIPPRAPEGRTMLLNRRADRPSPRQIYIGRPSKWGNPLQADGRRRPDPHHRPVPLDCLSRHTDPACGGDPEWRGPVKERARHAAGRFAEPADAGAARTAGAGAAVAALRAAVERAERAMSDDDGSYSVSKMHDAALDLAEAARALLNELETRHTE